MAGPVQDAERDGRLVIVEAQVDGPPLVLISANRLTKTAIENLKASWEAAWRGDAIESVPKLMVLERGLQLYQLVAGEWREIGDAEDRASLGSGAS